MGIDAILLLCYALELATAVPGAVFALLPVRDCMRRRSSTVYASAVVFMAAYVLVGAAICAYLECPSNWLLFAFMPLMLAVYSYVVNLRVDKVIFCFLFAALLCIIGCMFANFLVAPLEIANPHQEVFLPVSSILCLGCEMAVGIMFYRTLTYELPALVVHEGISGSWASVTFVVFLMCALLLWINPYSYDVLMEGRIRVIALLVLGVFTLILQLLFDMVYRLVTHLAENARLRQENGMLSMEERRYGQLKDYMDKTREMRHDFRQHLRVIDQLARSDQRDELVSYVSELVGEAAKATTMMYANRAVDAVYSYYDQQAAQQGSRIEWSLDVPGRVFVKESDLCSVLGNLVENALQAVANLPEERRVVRVTARLMSEGMLGIVVRNPYEGTIRLGRNGLPRIKSRNHGIGLASVRTIVQRYGGSFDLNTEGGEFAVSILMYGSDETGAVA